MIPTFSVVFIPPLNHFIRKVSTTTVIFNLPPKAHDVKQIISAHSVNTGMPGCLQFPLARVVWNCYILFFAWTNPLSPPQKALTIVNN
jgi:hypothetical protein